MCAQAGGLTLWLKRTDVREAQFDDATAAPLETVAQFRRRLLNKWKLDVDPGLVSLRLVLCTGEDEPTAAQEASATSLNPRKRLAEAGVTDGSWLLAVVSAPPGTLAGATTLRLS